MSHPDSTPARFTLDPAFTVGSVNPRLFGSFVEHMGRCVYTGIYEPGHPAADADGPAPGRPGPGPRARCHRRSATPAATSSPATAGRTASARARSGPRRLDLAWQSTETNAVRPRRVHATSAAKAGRWSR